MHRKIAKICNIFAISILVVCLWGAKAGSSNVSPRLSTADILPTALTPRNLIVNPVIDAENVGFQPVPVDKTFKRITETVVFMDHPKINYIGRFDESVAAVAVRWGWPGSYFRVRIEGTSFKLALAEPDNHTLVFIDGIQRMDIPPTVGTQKITVATDLDPHWSHDVVVYKRSEYSPDPGRIYNLFLDGGADLLEAPEHDRKIVFIGDSFTAGYGNVATEQTTFPDSMTRDEDTSQTYAAYTADTLNADYQVIATSGTGIFRNRTDSATESLDSMANEYTRVISGLTADYDFSKFQADLVHIFIGINDYAAGDLSTDSYVNNYLALINGFRARNPGVKFLCAGFGNKFADTVEAMVAAEKRAGKTDIEYYFLPDMALNPPGDWHPSVQGFKQGSVVVTAAIQEFMGW